MAMKSASTVFQILAFQVPTCQILIIGILLSLLGCASNSVQKESKVSVKKDVAKILVDTTSYIPLRIVDEKTGQLLPYQMALNPYLKKSGRIEASLVTEFILARRAYQNKSYTKAKSILEGLTKQDHILSGPWVMLGDIAQKDKNLKQAVENYARAIEINQNNVNAYIRLAKVQRQLGDFIGAQNTYNGALVIWKDFPEAHLNLAILYDIYLNKQIKSQRHLEAYLFLVDGRDKKQTLWLKELQQRTGKEIQLKVDIKKAISETAS